MKKHVVSGILFIAFVCLASGQVVPVPIEPEIRFPGPNLPPPTGVYISPADFHVLYANGVVIEDIRHRRFTQSQPPPPPGGSQTHTFDSIVEMRVRTPTGATLDANANASATVRVTHAQDDGGRSFYDTEMLQLDVSGGNLPPGAMVRESPTLRSTGQTSVRMDAASAQIGSFFDIFTELSLDGGATWVPAQQSMRVELRVDPTTIPPAPAPTDLLPPPNHMYVTPAQYHALYAQGIVIRNIRHRFFTRSMRPPGPNGSQIHEFASQVDMEVSQDGGQSWRHVRAPALTAVALRHVSGGGGGGGVVVCNPCTYETEMLQLEITGGDLPAGVMLRESPTRQSTGGTALRHLPDGTAVINSFFDVFTELSMDGGQNWREASSPARVELTLSAPETPEPTPNLPPPDGEYVSPADYHVAFAQGIIIKDIRHNRFTQSMPPPPPGGSQVHQFGSQVQFLVSTDGGSSFSPASAPAQVTARVTSTQEEGATRYFETEMLQLDIAGGALPPNIRLRESPTRASLGRTSIRQASDSQQISSFFDIFTELSVDGGQTWQTPISGPASVILKPGPCYHLDCPENITVYSISSSGVVVNYPAPVFTFTPPCLLPVTPWIQCTPASGSTFPLGTTTVTCKALVSPYASLAECSFQVTVKPTIKFAFKNIYALIKLQGMDGQIEDINLTGVTDVDLELGANGEAGDLDGDGLDDAAAHITAMNLRGDSSLGPVLVRLRGPARGLIEELGNAREGMLDTPPYGAGAIDSFFDVFVDIELPDMQLHNETPIHMAATLRGIPPRPGETYMDKTSHELMDARGNPTGVRLVETWHIPIPQPADVICPKDIVVSGDGPTPVNYIPLQSGDCQPITVACNPPSGSAFPIGITVVQCTATDACGTSDQCQFTVTVWPKLPLDVLFPTDHLPPPEGMYVNPFEVRYENGVHLRNIIHRNSAPSYPPPPLGETALHEFDSMLSFEWSMDGVSYSPATAPAHVVVQITHTHDDGRTMHFDTEMLALDVSGGALPPEVRLRESPTLRSTGKLLMTRSGSGWLLSSFFDVSTELSMDGGVNYPWESRDSKMTLQFDPTKIPPINTPNTKLPPLNAVFVSLPAVQQSYGQGVIIRDIRHRYFSKALPAPPPGESQVHEFDALVDFQLSLDGGQRWRSTRAEAKTVVVVVHAGRLLESADRPVTHLYNTAILQMDISGGDLPANVMLRIRNPGRANGGIASRSWPDGTHEVHSFFDVFTEISVDGGQTWQGPPDDNAPARMELKSFAPESTHPTDELPPPRGIYAMTDLDPLVAYASGAQMLKDFQAQGPTRSITPPEEGAAEVEFQAGVSFQHSMDGGQTWLPYRAIANFVVQIEPLSTNQINYWDTEILAMNIQGGTLPPGVMIRESPTRASLGRTSIRLALGGPDTTERISSFFDVFTELSIDGGQTWMPSDGPANVALGPNRTEGKLVCADGKPLENCPVRVEFYNQNGLAAQTTGNTDASGYFNIALHAVGPHFNSYFVVSTPCCDHTWTIPSASPSGDLGTLVCDACGRPTVCTNPPPDMVSWWTFDEPSGPFANDIEDYNNQGEHRNGPTVVAGKVKNALCFNGINQYVVVGANVFHPEINFMGSCFAMAVPESFTIDAWIKAESSQGLMTILDKRAIDAGASLHGYRMFIDNGRLGFEMADNVSNYYIEPAPSITPGVWHHVAVAVQRCDNGVNVGRLYVDGNVVHTFTPALAVLFNDNPLWIGGRLAYFGYNFFRGCIDELEFFKRALRQDEIRAIYNAGSGGKCKPCIRCPDDITVETCEQGASVCYQLPAVSPICPGLTVRCDPPPCSFFPANTSTLVVCQAFNAAGVPVERCTFAVTVLGDTVPPAVTCPEDISSTVDPGQCGRLIVYPVSAVDNCPAPTVSCIPPPGSVFPVGWTLVTCTATDASGNTNSCTFSITIRDHYNPIIACPNDITVRTCDRRTPVYYNATATDNCPGVTAVCVPPSGTLFPGGSHPVTCTATDASGNTASCSFKVTVIVLPPPKLEITYIGNGQIRICWETECPEWRLQCTRSLNPPIMWQFVSAPVTTIGNRYCVTLPVKGAHQFYRLVRREVKEVDAADDLLPPLGTYRSPDDLVTPFFIGGDPDRPLLMRRFAQPIPPDTARRPPPCPGCPPDLHEVQAQIMFEVSTDGGETWSFYAWPCKWLVGLQSEVPPNDHYEAELVYLEARGDTAAWRIRESPTRQSLGRTVIHKNEGGYDIGSFFDVWPEISLDEGQTWHPSETPVPMDLTWP